MQRDPALRHLSSDHHTGLVIARRARVAAQDGAQAHAAWTEIVERFQTELNPHFLYEERRLLPALHEAGEVDLVQRTLAEHERLRELIANNNPADLGRFAELLTAHIRFEEQVLFEVAQRLISTSKLAWLAADDEYHCL